jgi:hypothetical protein
MPLIHQRPQADSQAPAAGRGIGGVQTTSFTERYSPPSRCLWASDALHLGRYAAARLGSCLSRVYEELERDEADLLRGGSVLASDCPEAR